MGHGKPNSYTSTVEVTYGIGSDTHVLVLFFFVGSDILYVLYSTQGTCINANHRRVRLLTYEKGRQQHGKAHPQTAPKIQDSLYCTYCTTIFTNNTCNKQLVSRTTRVNIFSDVSYNDFIISEYLIILFNREDVSIIVEVVSYGTISTT